MHMYPFRICVYCFVFFLRISINCAERVTIRHALCLLVCVFSRPLWVSVLAWLTCPCSCVGSLTHRDETCHSFPFRLVCYPGLLSRRVALSSWGSSIYVHISCGSLWLACHVPAKHVQLPEGDARPHQRRVQARPLPKGACKAALTQHKSIALLRCLSLSFCWWFVP